MASEAAKRADANEPCPKRWGGSGGCMCEPKCAVCGYGIHSGSHMRAYDWTTKQKVAEYYDHAFVEALTKTRGEGQ